MKKLIAPFCAALAFCAVLCGCGDKSQAAEKISVVSRAEKEAQSVGEFVGSAREETYSYTDGADNGYNVTFRIPEILVDSSDAARVNNEIYEKYKDSFVQSDREAAKKLSLSCTSLDYEYYVNGEVLSVLIKRGYYSHNIDYTVYSFDTKSGEELTNEKLIKKLGLTYDEARKKLIDALESDYDAKYGNGYETEENTEYRAKTLDDENLDASVYYIDRNGRFSALCAEYAVVNSSAYYVLICLE